MSRYKCVWWRSNPKKKTRPEPHSIISLIHLQPVNIKFRDVKKVSRGGGGGFVTWLPIFETTCTSLTSHGTILTTLYVHLSLDCVCCDTHTQICVKYKSHCNFKQLLVPSCTWNKTSIDQTQAKKQIKINSGYIMIFKRF